MTKRFWKRAALVWAIYGGLAAANVDATRAEGLGAVIWAKDAVPIKDGHNCSAGISSQTITAPDAHTVAKFVCRGQRNEDTLPTLSLSVPTGGWQVFELRYGAIELLWAPDSKSFLINGGENAYTNYLEVYRLQGSRWHKLNVTSGVQRDMVRSFPPCKALNRDIRDCQRVAANPEFNIVGIKWSMNSSALIVMAEVPCSSSYGGIMCQVRGYEIGVPGGAVAQRMTARELKSRWQKSMGWELRIPDPPAYGPPYGGK